MSDDVERSVHWTFWAIVAAGLLFNLMGCANFVLQMSADRVAAMPETYREIVESRPVWATAAFAVAVFAGVLGGVLMLCKRSLATPVFVASFIGALGAQIPLLGMAEFPVEAMIGGLSQLIVGVFLVWYSRRAGRRGWLR